MVAIATTSTPSSLGTILREAAFGRPPVANGDVTILWPPPGPTQAVLGFTGHHVIAVAVDEDTIRRRLRGADLGVPLSPTFLLFLAGWVGAEPRTADVLLTATAGDGDAGCEVWRRDDLANHPRVQRAARYRRDLVVYADRESGEPDGIITVGRGLAARWEMAFEVEPAARGRGLGRRLAAAALTLAPEGEPVFAQVAPANVASLRACIAAGYDVIGAEALFAAPVDQVRP
jgi:GNAT superfamily N-acetyltransferase